MPMKTRINNFIKENPVAWRVPWILMKCFGIAVIVMAVLFYFFTTGEWNPEKRVDAMVRVCSGTNLQCLYYAMQEYAADHDGWYPDNLRKIAPHVLNRLNCPGTHSSDDTDYEYQFGLKTGDKTVRWLLRDKRDNHKNVINVLYTDGTVKTEKK